MTRGTVEFCAAYAGHPKKYLPAAGRDWALPLYDPLARLMGIAPTRDRLIEQARIGPGQRVLEIGCGTGDVLIAAKRLHPHAEVVGLDPDPKALARARQKCDRASLAIQLDRAFSDAMPYASGSFDRVLSSFMFHHLPAGAKTLTMGEVRRVLKPGGFVPPPGLRPRPCRRARLPDPAVSLRR